MMPKYRKYLPEIIAFILFVAGVSFVTAFHEPWFDEGQAWQTARHAPIYSLIFEQGVWQGHPPLWWFILLPFARLGFPFEITVKALTILFSSAGVGLLLFKSPIIRPLKLVLPFTYFFFYQYTVISRPYGLLIFAFMLAACFYKTRNEKPIRYALALTLVAYSHFLAFLFVFGIAVTWVIEIIKNEGFKAVFKGRRFAALLIMALLCGFLGLTLLPRGDTVWREVGYTADSRLATAIFSFIVSPAEALFFSYGFTGYVRILDAVSLSERLLSGAIAGLVCWIVMLTYARKRGTTLLLVLAYLPFALFCTIVYTANTHTGVPLMLFVFWYWASLDSATEPREVWTDKLLIKAGEKSAKFFKRVFAVAAAFIVAIPVCQTITCSVYDIYFNYAESRATVEFVKEFGLNDEGVTFWCGPLISNVNYVEKKSWSVAFLPYFEDDTFVDDFIDVYPGAFNSYKSLSKDEYAAYLKTLSLQGYPDVFMLSPDFEEIFEDDPENRPNYNLVAVIPSKMFNKADSPLMFQEVKDYSQNRVYIYMTPEYTEKSGLLPLALPIGLPPNDGIIFYRK
jgi:hypothetical protein